jgi:hypothetical protein
MKHLFVPATIIAAAVFSISYAPTANAQYTGLIRDSPTITVGNNRGAGYCTPAATACNATYGSTNPAMVEGVTLAAFVDLPGTGRMETTYFRTQLALTGFASDPGKNELAWANCGGVIYRGAEATVYSYSGGRAAWFWNQTQGAQPAFQGRTTVRCDIFRIGDSGWIRPKYQVAGLTYAPPGSRSSANYQNGFMHGTSTSHSRTFTTGVNYTESVSLTGGIGGVVGGGITAAESGGWSQTKETNGGVRISQQTSNELTVPGPASSGAGVDHNYDTIYVWLNPMVFMMVFNTSVVAGDYGYDTRDPVIGMDVVPLTVGQLKGLHPIPPNLWSRLNRTWDTALGGLTTADFQDILLANPFASNPGYNPNTDPNRRYELPLSGSPPIPANLILNYAPVPPGGQPTGQSYSTSYSSTTEVGRSVSDTHKSTFSFDVNVSFTYVATLTAKLGSTQEWSTTNKWSETISSGTSQSARFTIFPPLSTDNYTGPTAIQVWKDNVYGTFMFYPLF